MPLTETQREIIYDCSDAMMEILNYKTRETKLAYLKAIRALKPDAPRSAMKLRRLLDDEDSDTVASMIAGYRSLLEWEPRSREPCPLTLGDVGPQPTPEELREYVLYMLDGEIHMLSLDDWQDGLTEMCFYLGGIEDLMSHVNEINAIFPMLKDMGPPDPATDDAIVFREGIDKVEFELIRIIDLAIKGNNDDRGWLFANRIEISNIFKQLGFMRTAAHYPRLNRSRDVGVSRTFDKAMKNLQVLFSDPQEVLYHPDIVDPQVRIATKNSILISFAANLVAQGGTAFTLLVPGLWAVVSPTVGGVGLLSGSVGTMYARRKAKNEAINNAEQIIRDDVRSNSIA